MNYLLKILFLSILLILSACSSGGDDDSSGGSNDSGDVLLPGSVKDVGATLCGLTVDGSFQNPPNYQEGEPVLAVQVIDSNLLNVTTVSGQKLIKLQGLGDTNGFDNTEAKKSLSSLVAERSFLLFTAGCTEDTISGEAQVGQLVTTEGLSLSEEVVTEYMGGVISAENNCSGKQVASCFNVISTGEIPEGEGGDSTLPTRQVSNFLWKPDSESPYNPGGLSILLDPCDVKVYVNGNQLLEYPTGNGRCVTVRSAQTGCSFGAAKVEVYDKATGELVSFGYEPALFIPNGCDRFEFEGVGGSSGGGESPEHSCDTAPATVQYRPALDACGGNAAVILSGSFEGAFSVQLRLPDGGDRLDEDCADADCSPYKVQRYIDGSGTKTACFGAPGSANLMNNVHHTSIKMAGDDSDPDRFCIPDMRVAVN